MKGTKQLILLFICFAIYQLSIIAIKTIEAINLKLNQMPSVCNTTLYDKIFGQSLPQNSEATQSQPDNNDFSTSIESTSQTLDTTYSIRRSTSPPKTEPTTTQTPEILKIPPMYKPPNMNVVPGRPMNLHPKYEAILENYLRHTPIKLDSENKIYPQLATGLSQNHFHEHSISIQTILKTYPSNKIVVYDLGLRAGSINLIKKNPQFIYRKFPFERFPPIVEYLHGMSFKAICLMMCILEFNGACLWFDSSIFMSGRKYHKIVDKYIYCTTFGNDDLMANFFEMAKGIR